ncbi:MAG: hypothetical protein ACK6AZ_11150, partial [Pseudanabaena sp.]
HLYAVGGSLRRLDKVEDLLWQGDVEQAIDLFAGCTSKRFINFLAYLRNHRHRIPEYVWLFTETGTYHWLWLCGINY